MAEVDTFLEEVAEKFFKLTEENTQLNEKILALQEDIDSGERVAAQGQVELPAEMVNFLEELKQDTAAINAEIVALKQDRSAFASLERNIKEAAAFLQKASAKPPQAPPELPTDLYNTLQEIKMSSEAVATEVAALKAERQDFGPLQSKLEEVIAAVQKTAPAVTPQAHNDQENLSDTIEEFRKNTEAMNADMADLKQELVSIQQIKEEIKSELQELLKSHFDDLDEKLSKASQAAAPSMQKPQAPAPLAAAIIEDEPAGAEEEETMLPGFDEQEETYDDDLEFLSEDDILDVDKLRGVFQSVLDSSVSDTPNSREFDDDSSSDLLFLEDILEEEHEPEVTFSREEENAGTKPKKEAEA
jgi:DNA repair exonuclease SbcCD ATPase subunit